ncbi:MAG: methyltransferase domain-containing protein [Candidatus Aenigmatarchaeota archaeon]
MKKLKILNVGCGNETYGTHFVDLYPSRKEVIKCDVNKQKLPFPSNFFDIVYSRNLFEHLTNPEFTLKEMKRVLKPKGKLVLITDYAHFWGFAVGKTHLGGYEKECKKEDRHYLLVNEWHLKNWFEKIGLKPIKIEFIEDDYKGNSLPKKIFKKIINILLQITPFRRMGIKRIKFVGQKPH